MSLTINTNPAAVWASYHLQQNNSNLKRSLNRLSSGQRITKPSDDAGGLAVSMKLNGSVLRTQATIKNVQNASSFLTVQDGILTGVAEILNRMGELKALSQDVLKSSSDIANYNAEFSDLQKQLYQTAQETFNGVSLFSSQAGKVFGTDSVTVKVFTSDRGDAGSQVSLGKSLLLSALTFASASSTNSAAWEATGSKSFAVNSTGAALSLGALGVSFFKQALENVASLRANNGATASRFDFSLDHLTRSKANLEAARGRIMDVDIAEESANLARNNVLVQASASMLAQANTAPNIALMLLS